MSRLEPHTPHPTQQFEPTAPHPTDSTKELQDFRRVVHEDPDGCPGPSPLVWSKGEFRSYNKKSFTQTPESLPIPSFWGEGAIVSTKKHPWSFSGRALRSCRISALVLSHRLAGCGESFCLPKRIHPQDHPWDWHILQKSTTLM